MGVCTYILLHVKMFQRVTENNIHIGVYISVLLKSVCYCCRFDPDRFTPEKNAKREPNSFVPFGFGRRICPGYIFANVEIGVYLAMLLRRYSITMVTTKPAQKVYGLVTYPKEDVFVKFHPR